jgi:predicted nucleic acid-binding protein
LSKLAGDCLDTSVVVAAFASWHESHAPALAVLDRQPGLPVQAALETYSVLTRLPAPHRAAPAVVEAFLRQNFEANMLALAPDRFPSLLSELARLEIVGGAAYDALIAVTAREFGRVLVTLDARAKRTYDLLGIEVEYVGQLATHTEVSERLDDHLAEAFADDSRP